MIVPLPKSEMRHPACAQTTLHMLFRHNKTLQTPPLVCRFFCAYEVTQTPHKNNMSRANTRSVLARFRDINWEKGEDFVKTFYNKKTCVCLVSWKQQNLEILATICSAFKMFWQRVASLVKFIYKPDQTTKSCWTRKGLDMSLALQCYAWFVSSEFPGKIP